MEEYIDLHIIQRRLDSGTYMNSISFLIDVKNVLRKAYKQNKNDLNSLKILHNLKDRFNVISKELNSFPFKQNTSNGEST
jgi:hypothetical protein